MTKRARILLVRILTRLAILGVIIAALIVYFFTGVFTIHTYVLIGVDEAYTESITRELENIAETKLFGFLPGNRSITPHRGDIKNLINETMPNTSSIQVYASSLHVLTVEVTSYTPLFSVSDTHAITNEGVMYREIHPIDMLPRITIATSTDVSPRVLQTLEKLVPQIDAVLYPVRYIVIDEYDDIRVYDETKRHALIFSTAGDIERMWSTVVSALDTDPLKSTLATEKDRLLYIDARFGNKVFYKFTNEDAVDILQATSTNNESVSTSSPIQ